jgi:DegV family protein with EDD domain
VVIGADVLDEGADGATPEMVAEALREFRPVSTSRPSPSVMLEVYERAAREGATGVVSVHLSGEMSGTFESAQLAAREASIPVTPVDTRQVGIATGYAVLAAADVRDAGGSAQEAAQAARSRAAASSSLFYVDTLEYLRRGGRMGAASALIGSALAVKPILRIEEGRVAPFERVRTAGKALHRLEELAVDAAGSAPVEVAVAHLANPDRAATLAERLRERLATGLDGRSGHLGEVGAVLGAHVGPGMVAVCVARR